MDHDLLTEPLLSWRDTERRRKVATLPGLLARMATGELTEFARVRAHQFHPWCMFLTQLAAIALYRAGESNAEVSEEAWRDRLLALTNGDREAWCLVVNDLQRPAFFQPPVPEGSIGDWFVSVSPDSIDVLVTAKNHDVKTELIRGTDLESWVYAMVTLQTMQGYPGRGYNRVARMKGGYGSRPRVAVARSETLQARFLHDVEVLLASWPDILSRGHSDGAISLVWTQPWDGKTSLAVDALAPHFIEVCWRIRLVTNDDGWACRFTTTAVRRCAPEVENGDVGDIWMPIERDGGALTIGSTGFNYQLLTRLLFSNDFEPAAAQKLDAGPTETVLFLAAALARGQGKTEGLHERALPLPFDVRLRLGQSATRMALGRRSAQRVEVADKMRRKVLYPALTRIARGDQVLSDDFSVRVDEFFFEHLFSTLDQDDEAARLSFEKQLLKVASRELQRAIDRCCVPDAQRFRAISAAESMFAACLKKNFPDLAKASAER